MAVRKETELAMDRGFPCPQGKEADSERRGEYIFLCTLAEVPSVTYLSTDDAVAPIEVLAVHVHGAPLAACAARGLARQLRQYTQRAHAH